MANRFSEKYGNKRWAFNYLGIKVMSRCLSYTPTSLPQEQAAKTDMLSVVSVQLFSIVYSWGGCGQCLHMTDHAPMKLEKYYTWIERRWHIPKNSILSSKCSAFPVSWGHGKSYAKVLATQFSTVYNTKYFDSYLGNHTSFSCFSRGSDVGM